MPEETPLRLTRPDAAPPRTMEETEAEVVALLAEFEHSVDALKKLCNAKPRVAPTPRAARGGAAAPPERAEQSRIEQARIEQSQISELRQSLETFRTDLAHRAADLDQRSSEIDRVRRELGMELERQKAHAGEQDALAQSRHQALLQREENLSAKAAALSLESETFLRERSRFHQSTASVDTQRAELDALRAGVETKLRELQRRETAFEENQNSNSVDARIADLNARLADAHALAEFRSGELANLRTAGESAHAQLAVLRQQVQQAQSAPAQSALTHDFEAVRVREKLEELLAQVRQELDAARAECVQHRSAAHDAEVALEDIRRQSTRVTDTTRELHEENDRLKQDAAANAAALEDARTNAEIALSQHAEFVRRQESAAKTIAALEQQLAARPDAETLAAALREEIEREVQAPLARAAERAEAAEQAAAASRQESESVRARLHGETERAAALQRMNDEHALQLAQRDEQLAQHAARQQTWSVERAESEQALRVALEQAAQRNQSVAALEAAASEAAARTQTLERSLNETREAAMRHESQAQRSAQDLASAHQRIAQVEAAARELRTQVDSAGTRTEADHAAKASLEGELAAARAHANTLQRQVSQVTQTLDEARVRFEAERTALQSALGDSSAEREQAQGAAAALEAALAQKQGELSQAQSSLHAAATQQAHTETLRGEVTCLTARLREATSVAEIASTRIRDLESAVQAADEQIADLQEKAQAPAASTDSNATEPLRAKLELLKDRLRVEIEARDSDARRIAELEAQAARPAAVHAAGGHALSRERQNRLRIHRGLRRDQAQKLRNLGDALRSRFEICEQLIGQRAQLAAAQQIISESQKKLQGKQASTRVGVVGFFAATTLLILAFLSWAAAGQVFPGRYASRVTIEADGRGRELPMDELREWQRFHENLVKSPAFVDKLADHMRKFGITTLASPAVLAARLKDDLSSETPKPGAIVLELRGDGAARTTRELNAVATRFVTEAQEMRTRRNDGAITTITKPAEALPEPIDNSRLLGAGSILGGSTLIAAIVSMLLYRKLASAKSKFESDIALAGMLDAQKWPNPAAGMDLGRKAA